MAWPGMAARHTTMMAYDICEIENDEMRLGLFYHDALQARAQRRGYHRITDLAHSITRRVQLVQFRKT